MKHPSLFCCYNFVAVIFPPNFEPNLPVIISSAVHLTYCNIFIIGKKAGKVLTVDGSSVGGESSGEVGKGQWL